MPALRNSSSWMAAASGSQAEEELWECLEVALELGDLAGVGPSTWIGWDRRRRPPSDSPNERSWWPVPPTAFVSPWAVTHGGVGPVGD
jgi:hypothetical protein